MKCFAVLTEKLEDARSDFVYNEPAMLGLLEVIGQDAKISPL